MSIIELLTKGHRIQGYNFTRTLFVMGYADTYNDDLQKRAHIGKEVAPFLTMLAEATR